MISALLFQGFAFSQAKVSDEDLEKFVEVYQEVQVENQKLQQGLAEMVEEEGMDVQRFQEIQAMQANPNADVDASESELATHKSIMGNIEKAQTEFQEKVSDMVEDAGMTMEKYQEVFAELQSNEELQQKFSELMQQG